MTARKLFAALDLAGCRPGADAGDLLLASDPPPGLLPALGVLHTGVRALASGREWVGLPPDGRAVVLDPAAPVPAAVKSLAVMGDRRWDRIAGAARLDLPGLFASESPTEVRRPKPRAHAAA